MTRIAKPQATTSTGQVKPAGRLERFLPDLAIKIEHAEQAIQQAHELALKWNNQPETQQHTITRRRRR